MSKIISTDLLFSYWIFVWAILYLMNVISVAPKFLIIIALLEVVLALYVAFIQSFSIYLVVRLLFINFWIKIVPFYYIWKLPITIKELYYSFLLFALYLLWLDINNQTLYNIYYTIIYTKNYKDVTTFGYIYDTCFQSIEKLYNQML